MHAEKAMELTYSSIEDRNIALLRERIQSETQTGYNFFYFVGCMCRFVRSIVQIISSVSLTFSFFMVDSVSLWAKLALIGGIAVTTIISIFTTKKSSQLINEFFSSCVRKIFVPTNITNILQTIKAVKMFAFTIYAYRSKNFQKGFYIASISVKQKQHSGLRDLTLFQY